MAERNISERLRRSILIYSAIGIFAAGLIISLVSVTPFYYSLKSNAERNLLNTLRTKTMAVEEYLSRGRDIALQVTSRTKIRQKLEAYNRGEANLNELVEFSTNLLMDAMRLSRDVAGISRLDAGGKLVIQIGLPIKEEWWPMPPLESREVLISGPVTIEKKSYIVIGAPIIGENSQRAGTDIVLFGISRLENIVKDYTGLGESGETLVGVAHENSVKLFFPSRNDKGDSPKIISKTTSFGSAFDRAFRKESGIISDRLSVLAYGPVEGNGWGVVVKMDKDELYNPVKRQMLILTITLIVLISSGTYGMILLLRPLTGKILIHEDDMRKQVQEKTIALQNELNERRKTEESLRESEDKFRVLSDSTTEGIAIHEKGNILVANRSFARIFGYELSEVIGKNALELAASDSREMVSKNIISGYEEPYEATGLRKDGTTFIGEIIGKNIQYHGRDIRVTIIRDITEHKKTEEARAFLANITEHATDAIVGLDLDTNIVSWNRGAEMIFGYSAQEILGKSWALVVPKEVKDACRERFKKATLKGFVETEETVRVTKDGRYFPAEMTLTALKDERGNHIGFVSITRDITERKKLEEQLRHVQKMEAIGQLAGGIAHEFNNILTAIIGYGNILLMKMRGDDPLRHNVEQILTSSERAAGLTQGLLTYSRKQITMPRPVNMNEIVRKTEGLLLRIIGEDIELKAVLTDEELTVMADRGQMEQVLMNLATNARDAMPDGGLLTISTELTEIDREYVNIHGYGESGIYALISVTDTGVGMDKKMMDKIFEPFFTTKEIGKGTGLGLAMVYGIIKQHDGYINVYSEPESGTTFKIYLPLIKVRVREKEPSVMQLPVGGTETVLVAEDDNALRKLIKTVLTEFGYNVIDAVDGDDAIEKFMENKDRVEILVLDVIMPKKNGKEAYEEIKKINPRIKALFTSGYTGNIIHKKGVLEEGINFILKPVSPKELLRKVREILDK